MARFELSATEPRLRMCGAIPLHPLSVFMLWKGKRFVVL